VFFPRYMYLPIQQTTHICQTDSPLISILSHLTEPKPNMTVPLPETSPSHPLSIDFLYTTRLPSNKTQLQQLESSLQQILFLPRLRNIAQRLTNANHPSNINLSLNLFLTNAPSQATKVLDSNIIRVHNRRINKDDLSRAISADTVCYICGPPPMTDEFVQYLEPVVGKERVLYEKWW
jgi:hypothetical protein